MARNPMRVIAVYPTGGFAEGVARDLGSSTMASVTMETTDRRPLSSRLVPWTWLVPWTPKTRKILGEANERFESAMRQIRESQRVSEKILAEHRLTAPSISTDR